MIKQETIKYEHNGCSFELRPYAETKYLLGSSKGLLIVNTTPHQKAGDTYKVFEVWGNIDDLDLEDQYENYEREGFLAYQSRDKEGDAALCIVNTRYCYQLVYTEPCDHCKGSGYDPYAYNDGIHEPCPNNCDNGHISRAVVDEVCGTCLGDCGFTGVDLSDSVCEKGLVSTLDVSLIECPTCQGTGKSVNTAKIVEALRVVCSDNLSKWGSGDPLREVISDSKSHRAATTYLNQQIDNQASK